MEIEKEIRKRILDKYQELKYQRGNGPSPKIKRVLPDVSA